MESSLRLGVAKLYALVAVIIVQCHTVFASGCNGKLLLRAGQISCEDKQLILHEHNRLRQLIALGRVSGQPGAADMMEMVWDDELAAVAQNWASNCQEAHDNLRHVRRFSVGQNIARTWTTAAPSGPYDFEPEWKKQIGNWFNEVHHYVSGYHRSTGHYTQMVWGNTFLVGCGYSFYYDHVRRTYTKNYVCNYGPSGNILGYDPYTRGVPSCDAYGMSFSNKWSGLCSDGHYYPLGEYCPSPNFYY